MPLQKIGILSIGEMGYHWARMLAARGVEVLSYLKDRGETTRKRAENAGVKPSPSIARLIQEADLIVSIVVPSAATRVATRVAKAALQTGRKDLLFLDANAISPMTAARIAAILEPNGVIFTDGCIIGSAAKMDQGAVVYVSGPQAARIEELANYGFSVKTLGSGTTQASAFKIVYAGLTKGLQALFVELLVGASKLGLRDEIIKRYEESFPGLLDRVASSIVGLRIHAGRRAEEMDELRRTFLHYGLNSFMAPAAEKLLHEIAALRLGEASDRGTRAGELLDTLGLFCAESLLERRRRGAEPMRVSEGKPLEN